jgi:hypothetical protein
VLLGAVTVFLISEERISKNVSEGVRISFFLVLGLSHLICSTMNSASGHTDS